MATVPPEILSKLIRGKNIILKRKLYEKVPDWVRTNILANTTLFLLGSANQGVKKQGLIWNTAHTPGHYVMLIGPW